MTDKRSSTGTTALAAINEDPEIQMLIRRLERRFPGEGQSRVYDLIMNNLSTSAWTAEYGQERPSGWDSFKNDLRLLIAGENSREQSVPAKTLAPRGPSWRR